MRLITVMVENTANTRSEEHTSELQSPCNLVCRLLLEKKTTKKNRDRLVFSHDRRHPDNGKVRYLDRSTEGKCSRGGGAFFFFNDTATTEIYTLSLHDALPI